MDNTGRNKENRAYDLSLMPKSEKTPEACLAAVKQDGRALHYVPENLKSPEICLEAVKRNAWAITDVPESMKTKDVC